MSDKETITEKSKLDAVKELIFGQNMVEYDQKFSDLEEKLNAKYDDQLKKLTELETTIIQKMQSLNDEMDGKLIKLEALLSKNTENLEDKKMDRAKLAKLLNGIADKIAS
jgi:hypothetical protein